MKSTMRFFFLAIIFLVGCTPITPIPAVEIPSATPRPTSTAKVMPTFTPLPWTPTVTITPTFDPSAIVAVTPAQVAVCPKVDAALEPTLGLPEKFDPANPFTYELETKVLGFLNQGGDYRKVIADIQSYYARMGSDLPFPLLQDLTGDSVPEIIIRDETIFPVIHIFSCVQGKYVDFVPMGPGEMGQLVTLYGVDDLNANNLPEILLDSWNWIGIYEWDGKDFRIINPDMGALGGVAYEFRDINNDRIKEVMLTLTAPVDKVLEFPWRSSTITYVWNGHIYSEQFTVFDPPIYRFQAIQDADREMLSRHFEKALSLYQDVIFSDQLEWWSKERRTYEVFQLYSAYLQENQVPPPLPAEDTTEYSRLAAYAYFRITLLHILQDHESDAGTVYQTLQQKFSEGNPGFPYAEMAAAFWNEYQSSRDMTAACGMAVEDAAAHPDILIPLGSDYHGMQSHTYEPGDVCPFR
jgi:hypothetical protein